MLKSDEAACHNGNRIKCEFWQACPNAIKFAFLRIKNVRLPKIRLVKHELGSDIFRISLRGEKALR